MKLVFRLFFASVFLLAAVEPSRSEDSDRTRYYLGLRYELAPGATSAHDIAGGTLGANVGKYLGLELSVDSYELKVGDVAELSVLGLLPQVRLRYPFLNDRLTPYLIGGMGLAVTQANDARVEVDWPGGKTGTHPMGTLGGGIEYFVADNIAVGVEGKYVFSGDVSYRSAEDSGDVDVNTGLLAFALRFFYPELHPEKLRRSAERARARFYLQARVGGARLSGGGFPGIDAEPEGELFGTGFTQLFGFSLGANIGTYAGVEISVDNYELQLDLPGEGRIGEYSVFPILVQPRVRYPMWNGRLEPFAFAGAGGEFAEFNDVQYATSAEFRIEAKDVTPIGVFGAGLDYFVMNNVAVGVTARYVLSRDHAWKIADEPEVEGDLDSWLLSLGLRVFFYDLL